MGKDTLARVAYEAYGESVGWKDFQGTEMPKFDDLPEKIKQAWIAAADAVDGYVCMGAH
jgi:hypothetical protein